MNYHNITKEDMNNGEGLRVVLWVSGCSHHCKNCHNPITWDVNGGIPFDTNAEKELFAELEKDYISGITFSGGDPLNDANYVMINWLCRIIKKRFPTKTIWLYTGYSFEDIKFLPILNYIDVLVDGKFVQELSDVSYKWAGSTNQRVIDVKQSIYYNEVILYESN